MDKAWLSKDECLALLGVPESLFDMMIEAGLIPDGLKYSNRTVIWERRVIEAASVLLPGLLKVVSTPTGPKK